MYKRQDLNKAAEYKYGKLPELQKQLAEEEQIAEKSQSSETHLLRDKVTEEEIAKIVARWTGIPVSKLMESGLEKLRHLDDILQELSLIRNWYMAPSVTPATSFMTKRLMPKGGVMEAMLSRTVMKMCIRDRGCAE